MDSTVMTRTRLATAWAATPTCRVVGLEGPRLQAPKGAVHGTGLSIAGTSEQVSGAFTTAAYAGAVAGQAALVSVRSTDLPGSPPRGAPV